MPVMSVPVAKDSNAAQDFLNNMGKLEQESRILLALLSRSVDPETAREGNPGTVSINCKLFPCQSCLLCTCVHSSASSLYFTVIVSTIPASCQKIFLREFGVHHRVKALGALCMFPPLVSASLGLTLSSELERL